ncbi:hypothetical protein SLEP1_g27817 [Rubroshorea leprosula]|uniref:Zinc finger, CCHC-type n=1 Tax=Rubroshorea leprosula TaxID=152421 RepID=A0AAV5JRK6_9ROSI|nr:hypothetical protein SLEP1_g27817 [Rubroshorea leprosula]
MAATLREMATNFQKLDRFDGGNFIRWQRKMHILLTTLNIVYVLIDARPDENENETLQDTRKRKKWENDDYACRGCILNGEPKSLGSRGTQLAGFMRNPAGLDQNGEDHDNLHRNPSSNNCR